MNLDWTEFKALSTLKNLRIQELNQTNRYWLFIYDLVERFECNVDKTTPRNADQADYEDNYQATSNQTFSNTTRVLGANQVDFLVVNPSGAILAAQSGVWNINDVTGTVSLPTGASTEATLQSVLNSVDELEGFTDGIESALATANGHLSSIDSDIDTTLSSRASETTLLSVDTHLASIDSDIDTTLSSRASEATLSSVDTSLASIDTDFDVALSTRASEATLSTATGHLSSIDSDIDVALSTRASEATLSSADTHLASIDTDIDVALSTRASESTLSTLNGKVTNDYGASSGAVRTASQVGNTTGEANFNAGTTGAQTLRTSSNITRNGTELSYNSGTSDANTLRTASNLKREGNDVDYNYGAVGANTLRTASEIGNSTGSADFNFGTVGAQTIRTASQIGNATGAANFNSGATGDQTLRTASNLYDSAANGLTSSSYDSVRPLDVRDKILSAGTAVHTLVTPTANVSTQLLAANTARKWAIFTNNSGGNFFIKFGTAAVANQGITIPSNGGSFFMNTNILYLGAINGLVTSNGRTIEIIEGT